MLRMSLGKESVIESITLVHSVVREVMCLESGALFKVTGL